MGCFEAVPEIPEYPQSFYRKPVIFFALGGPGSGKASYCDRLVKEYRFKYLSVKDLVTIESTLHTAQSRQIKECISKGILIPSDIITRLLKKAIANQGPRAFLVDGFPRNMENVESFYELLVKEVLLIALIYFDCSPTVMESKIRADGNNLPQDKIHNLMDLYEREVLPVIRHFALKDVLIRINTQLHPTFEENYTQVKTALSLFNIHPPGKTKVYFASGQVEGKSKLLKAFCRRYGMYRINISSILRSLRDNDNQQQSGLIKHYERQGKSIPAQVTLKLVAREIQSRNYLNSFLIEGFPKSIEEIQFWVQTMLLTTQIKGVILFARTPTEQQRTINHLQVKLLSFQAPLYYVNPALQEQDALKNIESKFEKDGLNRPIIRKSRSPKIIMIIGAPGSGKGSQCERLRQDFGFDYVSTAEMLRTEISQHRIYSQMIQTHISSGKLVPSEILVRLIKRYVFEQRVGNKLPLILDGFPRNLANMNCWEDEVGDQIQLAHIIHFECSQKIMEERLINTKNSKNMAETPQTIVKRFSQYIKETEPVLDLYRQQGLVITINCERGSQDVYIQLREAMKSRGYTCLK